jgi:hypothetical protein
MLNVFGNNVENMKMEVRVEVENFLSKATQKFHIIIWFYMKFEDLLEVLPLFMPESFLDRFVFIWGHEQCSKMSNEI